MKALQYVLSGLESSAPFRATFPATQIYTVHRFTTQTYMYSHFIIKDIYFYIRLISKAMV